jgi:GNAT superfamily N-acetyltransferase
MRLRIVPEEQMTPVLDAAIRHGLVICFPEDAEVFSQTRVWHGSAPAWSVVLEHDGEVIAHVGVVDRVITAGGHELRAAGIQNVFVLPEFRRRGLTTALMEAAMREAEARGFDLGLLFCLPDIERVYSRSGWLTLDPRPLVRVDENGNEVEIAVKNLAMFYPLRQPSFPQGVLNLGGNDW